MVITNTLPKHPLAKCELCTLRNCGYVPSTIVEDSSLVVIGEAPGAMEVNKGAPFVGQSGQLLRKVIDRTGTKSDATSYINVVSCRPPDNRTPTPDEIDACSARFNDDLAKTSGTILTVGLTASEAVTPVGLNTSIGKRRGNWTTYQNRSVMHTWHPAYILRKSSEMETFLADITRAVRGTASTLILNPKIRFINTRDELYRLVDDILYVNLISFDIETDHLVWYDSIDKPGDKILMFALAWSVSDAAIINAKLLYDDPSAAQLLNTLFKSSKTKFVGHNAKFDCVFVRAQLGINVHCDYDTMLAHYAINEQPGTHGLKQLTKTYFGANDYEDELVKPYIRNAKTKYSQVPYKNLATYAAMDVCYTLALWQRLEKQLVHQKILHTPFNFLYMPINEMFTQMELEGMHVDIDSLNVLKNDLVNASDSLQHQVQVLARNESLNLNSPAQLSKLLYNDLRLPQPTGYGMKDGTTSREALRQLEDKHPIVKLIVEYRRVQKMLSSYAETIIEKVTPQSRVHAQFYLHGTETGRISVREPALQTIPRATDTWGARIKQCFDAPKGWTLVIADYSQAELRVFAALTGEPFLIDAYNNNRDLHSEVALAMFGPNYTDEQRTLCKTFNFAYIYGGNEYSMLSSGDRGAQLDITVARDFVRRYNANMPIAAQWKKNQIRIAANQGYIETRTGRRRRFPIVSQGNYDLWDDLVKASMNMPVQGLASDLTLIACQKIRAQNIMATMVVHDSIICEVPIEDAERVKNLVRDTMVDVGTEWCPEVKWKADAAIVPRWGYKEK